MRILISLSSYKRDEIGVLSAVFLIPIFILIASWSTPIVDHFGFRQTQTALTSYWMQTSSSNIWEFITPVFGYPWSAPMEYPIYQMLVYLVSSLTWLSLENTARVISIIAFYAALWPLRYLLGETLRANLLFYVFYLSSPILLFYSSRFLIESFSFFLCISAFASFVSFLEHRTFRASGLFVCMCVLAGLQKITGLMSVLIGCGLYGLCYLASQDRSRVFTSALHMAIVVAVSVLVPIAWVLYGDDFKAQHYLTDFLRSGSLANWNYGTLEQRLNPFNLAKVFGFRLILLGGLSFLLLRCLVFEFRPFNNVAIALSSLVVGLSGPIVFFNLYLIHDYYNVASIGFVGLGLYLLVDSKRYRFSLINVSGPWWIVATLVFNISIFTYWYLPKIGEIPASHADFYSVALKLKSEIGPEKVILTAGADWDSTIPYISERHAIMLPNWVRNDTAPMADGKYFDPLLVLENIKFYLGGKTLGAIVICSTRESEDLSFAVGYIIDKWELDWQSIGDCSYGIVP